MWPFQVVSLGSDAELLSVWTLLHRRGGGQGLSGRARSSGLDEKVCPKTRIAAQCCYSKAMDRRGRDEYEQLSGWAHGGHCWLATKTSPQG